MTHVSGVGVRVGERKLVNLVLAIKAEGEAEDVMILMLNRLVIVDLGEWESLPLGSSSALHQRGHAFAE